MDILSWNSDNFLGLIEEMKYLEDELVFDIMFGKMDFNKIVSRLLRDKHFWKNRIVIKNLVKSIFI